MPFVRYLAGTLATLKQSHLGLRSKFLLSIVLTTLGLTLTTLLSVRDAARQHAQQEIVADAGNALMTFQVLLHQNEVALERKADLLSTLAAIRDGDSSLQDSVDDGLETDGSDLVVLTDKTNRITALHSSGQNLSPNVVRELLLNSLARKTHSDWWYINNTLYQVVLQPIARDVEAGSSPSGTVLVGRAINNSTVHDLGRISGSEVVFSYGTNIVASTLNPFDEQAFGQRLTDLSKSREIEIGGNRYFSNTLDLTNVSGTRTRVTVLKSYAEMETFLNALNRLHIGLGLLAMAGGTFLAIVLSGKFTRPIANLDKGVQALELGDFEYPLEAHGNDEVARLTRAFDHMRRTLEQNQAQKQHLEDELRQSQKLDALGRLAGGVAHDFNNLLTIIKGHCDLMLERLSATDPTAANGVQIRKAADRAASLTRQMLAFSRRQPLEPTVFDLKGRVSEMSKLLKRLIREDIEFVLRPGESLGRIRADAGQIEQVILNLVVNACDAMPQGGTLAIETRNVIVDEQLTEAHATLHRGRYILLTVSDTGQGMNEETKARMFEPFFTTKEKGKGTGLGLATVYGVVKQSGGFIQVATALGQGTTFSIYLPHVDQQAEQAQTEACFLTPRNVAETVLLVEDESDLRSVADQFLGSAGYRVFTATDGEDALAVAEALIEPIHLLVTDVVMPKMRGTELAKRLRCRRPNLKVVYVSGYLEENEASGDFVEGALYLQKPFSRNALLECVDKVLSSDCSALVNSL